MSIKVNFIAIPYGILRFLVPTVFTKYPLARKKMEMTKTTEIASNASPFSALFAMFYEPSSAFGMLEPKRHAWLPLVLLMLCSLALMTWYFSMVDAEWLLDQMMSAMKPAERDAADGRMSKTILQTSATITTLAMYPLMCALAGVYFMLAGKTINKDVGFGGGFALSAWASVPGLLMLPMGAIAILMSSGGQLGFSELNPLSLNQLVFHHPMSHPMASLFDSISLISIWTMFLTIIGFQVWAKVARSTAVKVVLIPYAVIYGVWIAIALSKAV